jgi:glycogen operon protein
MLLGGDEMGRTQNGNNNAYCQDNEVSWYDWEDQDVGLRLFAQQLIEIRHRHPVFRRRRYFQGRPLHGAGVADIAWYRPDGVEMSDDDWQSGQAKSMAVFLNGDAISSPDPRGEPVVDDSFLVVFNAHHEVVDFVLPEPGGAQRWVQVFDTADVLSAGDTMKPGELLGATGRSITLLRKAG